MSEELSNSYVKSYYDDYLRDLEGDYADQRWFRSETERAEYEQTKRTISSALGAFRCSRGLEVGPGDGVWTQLFLEHCESLVLVDQSSEMVKRAAERLGNAENVSIVEADFASFVPTAPFEFVAAIRCFEYFEDQRAAVDSFFRALAPDGMLLLVTKNPKSSFWRKRGSQKTLHQRQVDLGTAIALFERGGFEILETRPATFRITLPVRGMKRLSQALHPLLLQLPFPRLVTKLSERSAESFMLLAKRPA